MKRPMVATLLLSLCSFPVCVCVCVSDAAEPLGCPTATDFVCRSGHCIESYLVCDNKADCADESDEIDCGEWR